MRTALVLNAGSSWGAYHIGALRYLLGEDGVEFTLHAGTGIGAMNAALVACGEFEALREWWGSVGLRSLLRPNLRNPWAGPATGTPQRRFIANHVSEARLIERGAMLLVSTYNVQTGREELLRYPGSDLPVVDALMAAVATPGLVPPVRDGRNQRAEGTVINSFALEAVVAEGPDRIVAIAATLPSAPGPPRYYGTWASVLERALAMNLARDVDVAVSEADGDAAARQAWERVRSGLSEVLATEVADSGLRTALVRRFADLFEASELATALPAVDVRVIRPTRELGYPIWRFNRGELAAAQALGERDARAVMSEP